MSDLRERNTLRKQHGKEDEGKDNAKGLSYLRTLITSSTLAKKSGGTSNDKNEPARFLGDGVSFKAKLIGILEVSEARGDRMCQEALADLKMAIRAAGEHKQRININIAIDGLRLRDEKTGDCLYHHPVHKISFIAQDMSDSRAFGYIFGSPDTGHRFFGIKTDKAASQVVITMRDLFQVVFELKKKEIEMAKQHIEQHQIKFTSFSDSANKMADENDLKKFDSSPPKDQFDVFTDLDPLGTGRSKPYIDKKDFFQDLKNPPKKVLKDLVIEVPADCKQSLFQGNFECDKSGTASHSNLSDHSNVSKSSVPTQLFSDPFQDDPFDEDPFLEVDFSQYTFTPSCSDPFEKFADFATFPNKNEELYSTDTGKISTFPMDMSKPAPLKVSLPPEKLGSSETATLSPLHSRRSNRLQKGNSLSCVLSKPPSPKQKHRCKLVSQTSSDMYIDRNSPIMDGGALKSRETNLYSTTTPDKQNNDISAPEPPPRSALNALSMKPPPLPPKRIPVAPSSKPPPRPPHSDYDYIENYQTTHFTDINSPPLPAPARKPKITGKQNSEPEYYLQPFPLLPPPKKKNSTVKTPNTSTVAGTTTSVTNSATTVTATNETNISSKSSNTTKKSLDITLSQLTKTGFSDLAATLNMSPTSLSKMTLQELTKCLANLSNDTQNKDQFSALSSAENSGSQSNALHTECYSALRESLDDDTPSFKAEFEAHFSSNNEIKKKEEESLFDKYAVFRELLEEEKRQTESIVEVQSGTHEDGKLNRFENMTESIQIDPPKLEKIDPPTEDRYAALREICLDEVTEEKYEDLSDKEDSIIEPSRLEEDTDLLPQSRAHSESTESPTITMKEHQSIIEATIMEEDISALDVDEEEVPEESIDETLKEQVDSELDSSTNHPSKSNYDLQFSPTEKFKTANENKTNSEINSSWAKFDSGAIPIESTSSVQSDGRVSPWSTEKDNDLSPACRDRRKHRKIRRHKQNQWQEDEESEEGWDGRVDSSWSPSWRENGWSDGDSLYDESLPYIERDYPSPRRGRRRRMSPWNSREQSPWEEDDRELSEDMWESTRWQDDVRQRPKHRGQSWEDERRRHYDEPRKPRNVMMWSNESHGWEEEERYQKRNYVDRRRRKWEEDNHNRNRSWRDRDWVESNMKINNRYCKERSHDPHWDSEYGDQGDDESPHWSQRPRSCDRGRRQFPGHHTSDGDFPDRRYMRSREGHCSDLDYRRKAQTMQRQKQRRKHSQTSPFEDDFSSQFGFSKESPGGPDAFDPELKKSPVSFDSHKKPGFSDSARPKDFTQYPSQGSHQPDYNRDNSGSKVCRSYQQSPFEDDFTSSDTRRCSGRSASSDMSDQRGSDEVFCSGHSDNPKALRSDIIKRPKSANQADTMSRSTKHLKNIPHLDESISKPNQPKLLNQPENELSDVNIAQSTTDKKSNNTDIKGRISNLKRSDSSSSLRKSESVNIFARNNDPFDDDFFCEESPAIHHNKERISKTIGHDSKWADSFNAFSFDEETK